MSILNQNQIEIQLNIFEKHSKLELMVADDMIKNGYNPLCKKEIEQYWKERLDD